MHVTKHMQIFRNNHPSSPVLNLWPTLSVLQSGPREHRWRLILSWLLYITVLRCWVHLRPPTELSQVLWDPCCCTPTQCSKQRHTTLNNMPADLKITWHMNYIRCCTRRYSLQASLTSPLNSSFSSPCPVCVCVYVYIQQQKTRLSGVCAAAGVVNQADDRHLLLPGYFTTPGWHCTTANETKNHRVLLLRKMVQRLYINLTQVSSGTTCTYCKMKLDCKWCVAV